MLLFSGYKNIIKKYGVSETEASLAGGLGAGGALSSSVQSVNRAYYNSLSQSIRLLFGLDALYGAGKPVLLRSGITISNVVANGIANLPFYSVDP